MSCRYGEGEGRALAGLAFEPDAPAVQLDEARVSASPRPGAFLLARVVAPDLAELLEHRLLVLGRDADAGVVHRDDDAVGLAARA